MSEASSPGRVRSGTRDDAAFVRDLSARVFSRFGDYDRTLPLLLDAPDVRTFVAEVDGAPVAFAMVQVEIGRAGILGDLVAIAVDPIWQGRGLGTLLLERTERFLLALGGARPPTSLFLCVADDNDRAHALFAGRGFEVTDARHGWYAGGQRSIAMRKRLR